MSEFPHFADLLGAQNAISHIPSADTESALESQSLLSSGSPAPCPREAFKKYLLNRISRNRNFFFHAAICNLGYRNGLYSAEKTSPHFAERAKGGTRKEDAEKGKVAGLERWRSPISSFSSTLTRPQQSRVEVPGAAVSAPAREASQTLEDLSGKPRLTTPAGAPALLTPRSSPTPELWAKTGAGSPRALPPRASRSCQRLFQSRGSRAVHPPTAQVWPGPSKSIFLPQGFPNRCLPRSNATWLFRLCPSAVRS